MINIGKSLKDHREYLKLTQTELAKKTGIKQQNISRWEKNTHIPNVIDCLTLASFYQFSIEHLIGLSDNFGIISFREKQLSSEDKELLEAFHSLDFDAQQAIRVQLNLNSDSTLLKLKKRN